MAIVLKGSLFGHGQLQEDSNRKPAEKRARLRRVYFSSRPLLPYAFEEIPATRTIG
ncbi:hypothetical protein [Noviherbaspirillum aerium]|uniref:hypothetical protein n=1 Tax=Noviherbaspirillum aerium TaxID=2588497 RepID=UPI00178C76F9|nr:hypothetical protein [Noviherbaspirillum aerium]